MAKDKISIKFLIHLVGERPALWDKTSEAYKDRSLKETSWREICTFINENYEHMQPAAKQEFTKMVTKKWTHIRDSWVKSMKYGYDDQTKLPPKPYVYHDELTFLQKVLKYRRLRYDLSGSSFERYCEDKKSCKPQKYDVPVEDHDEDDAAEQIIATDHNNDVSLSITTPDEEVDDDWPLEDIQTSTKDIKREPSHEELDSVAISQKQKPRLKRHRSNNYQQYHCRPCTMCNRSLDLNDNRHWNFFKGIFPSVNNLDEDHSLQFQAGIITLLQKLKASQKQSQKSHKTKKLRKTRVDAYNHPDYEFPMHKVDMSMRYLTRSTKSATDPIAGEEEDEGDDDESELSSGNF